MSWPVYKLGEIAEVIRGVTFSKADGSDFPEKGRIPIIRAGSIQKSLLINEGQIWVSDKKVKNHQLIKKHDIIMCTSSGSADLVGKCAKSKGDYNVSFGAFCAGIRSNVEYVSPSYLYHFLCSPSFRNWTKNSSGANIKNIRASELAEFEIPLPPLVEQKRIAAILDKADAIRQKRKQAIELADEFLRSVFLEMFGDPVTNPKGWKVKPLSGLIAEGDKINYGIVQPGEHVDGGVPIVRVGDIADGKIDKSKLKCVLKEIDEKNKKSRLIGDEILITCVGATVGKVALADSSLQGFNTVRALTRVRLSNQVNRQFVFRYLQSPFVQNYFQMQLRTVGQPTLNGKQIGETPILLPEKDVQKSFLDIAEKLQSKIDAALAQLVNADDMFNSLSQKAFSGQL
ncbi:restriction endonuclease subunit S [Vibrio furnissii]|uniref:restriction endonuclease subunit S n=1 Tax=Vibrio furnissii TaxID=29494 RepID=UPI001C9CE4FD|nr:restriction endonuclease subunit S [Vibrio furnissii]ELL4669644.1 restriction endonuclease subunit S [Vibrio fluvialis]MBY8100756.1 restriction endonuclease subunit S [Vibrio fluvialis]MCG6233018.1 restriction endonuclease subunit S [Vibrio furnissii]MCG6258885.1 restriction endonuclease subunit S [Vibrio furnissii]